MTEYLPWIALVLALIAVVARDGVLSAPAGPKQEPPAGAFLILAGLVVATIFAGLAFGSKLEGIKPATMGFAIGALLSAVAYAIGLMPFQSVAGKVAPIALAAAAASFTAWLVPGGSMTFVFGAAAASWLLSIGKMEEPNPWAMRSAVAAAAIVACNELGRKGDYGVEAAQAGVLMALAAVIGGIIGGIVTSKTSKASPTPAVNTFGMVLGFAILAGAAWLIGDKLIQQAQVSMLLIGGGFVGLLVHWLLPVGSAANSVRLSLAAIIWVGVATAAFGFEIKGFGMSLALLGGVLVLLLTGNPRALLTIGPFAALVFYRVFREEHIEASRALDIGQHYAMIGVLLGAVLPVMAQEWLRGTAKKAGFFALLAGALWIVVLAGTPVVAAILLSAKGVIGYVVGLGIASVIEAIRGERSAHSLSLALGLSALMTLFYDWLLPYTNMERADKVSALLWIGGVLFVAAVVIALLSGDTSVKEEKVANPS